MADGNELIRQTVETVLGTNKGEWAFNQNEGINFDNILIKNPNFDIIRNEVANGIKQVDSSFVLQEFNYTFDKNSRLLKINFKAKNVDDEEITGTYTY